MPFREPDWLLARFDRLTRAGYGPAGRSNRARFRRGDLFERPMFERPMFEVLDDHPGDDCDSCDPGETEFYPELGETG